jgi:K+-transporting ATPase A subunit
LVGLMIGGVVIVVGLEHLPASALGAIAESVS